MRLLMRQVDRVVVLSCSGVLSTRAGYGCSPLFASALARGARVVLNLGGISRVDVAGLGVIYSFVSAARRAEARVAVVLPKSGVDLATVRLLTLDVPVFAAEEEALQALHDSGAPGHTDARYDDLRAA